MQSRKHSRRSLALILVLGLAACGTPRAPVTTSVPLDAPIDAASYLQRTDVAPVYEVDSTSSRIFVRVGRSGAMARFGHDHIVASESVSGFVELDDALELVRADLAFATADLIVDKPEYRARFALDTSPSEQDVSDTYTNMLKVLQPAANPWVQIAVAPASADAVQTTIQLNGRSITRTVPVDRTIAPDRLRVSGRTRLSHSEFGLEPFTALGGLLAVADEFDVIVEIDAVRR